MLNIGTRRELLERLIVSELISKRGEGALARKQFTRVPRMLARAVPDNEASAPASAPETATEERKPDERDEHD